MRLLLPDTLSLSLSDFVVAEMLRFLRRTLGRRSMRKHAEKERLREAQRAPTHIPAAGDAKSVITCRVSLLDGTDVSVDLPVRGLAEPQVQRSLSFAVGSRQWVVCVQHCGSRAHVREPWPQGPGMMVFPPEGVAVNLNVCTIGLLLQ